MSFVLFGGILLMPCIPQVNQSDINIFLPPFAFSKSGN